MSRGLKIFLGIFTGVAASAGAIGLYGRKIMKNISYSYGKPTIEPTGFLKPIKIIIPLAITNNNSKTLEVTDFDGTLYAGRRDKLAKLSIDKPLKLEKGISGETNLVAMVRLSDLAGEIVDIFESGELMPDSYILGKLKTNLITVPVYYKLNTNAGVGELPAGSGELKKVARRQLKTA